MNIFARILTVILLIGTIAGCDSKPAASENEIRQTFVKECLNNSITQGNHTYIPFYISYPREHVSEILEILNKFEEQHPDLKITHWHIDTGDYTTYGLWVDHEPRTK